MTATGGFGENYEHSTDKWCHARIEHTVLTVRWMALA